MQEPTPVASEITPITTYGYLLQKYGVRMTWKQAETELGISWQTVRNMCARGEIKAIQMGAKWSKWVLPTKAIADYLDNGTVPAEKVVPLKKSRSKYERIV